jgi:hypothetical protein
MVPLQLIEVEGALDGDFSSKDPDTKQAFSPVNISDIDE